MCDWSFEQKFFIIFSSQVQTSSLFPCLQWSPLENQNYLRSFCRCPDLLNLFNSFSTLFLKGIEHVWFFRHWKKTQFLLKFSYVICKWFIYPKQCFGLYGRLVSQLVGIYKIVCAVESNVVGQSMKFLPNNRIISLYLILFTGNYSLSFSLYTLIVAPQKNAILALMS